MTYAFGAFYNNIDEATHSGYIDPVKFETPSAVLEFDANISNRDVFNAIAGHANGQDIHPYSIKLLPILIY